jgi:hypothetical protein
MAVPQDRPLPFRVTQMRVQLHAQSIAKDVVDMVMHVAAVN